MTFNKIIFDNVIPPFFQLKTLIYNLKLTLKPSFLKKLKSAASSSLFEFKIYTGHIHINSTMMSFPLSVESQHKW